jgi:hypothetical protein
LQPTFLNQAVLDSFPVDEFVAREPFPWSDVEQLLTPEAFDRLLADFPPLSLFAWHAGQPRVHGQRPQDRWYLAYEASPYENYEGVARKADLPEVWQGFIEELESNDSYRALIAACLGRDDFDVRFAWHLGVRGSEVCPHVDDPHKAGTHIYYFNTEDDWAEEWGAMLVLDDKHTAAMNPDFSDFGSETAVPIIGNRSFLFKNQPGAWHGVKTLPCPDGQYRRLFNVIFEHPDEPAPAPPRQTLSERAKRRLARLRSRG